MIAAWMIYATLVAALLAGGALALDRALRLAGRQARWIWIVALAASLALPLLAGRTLPRASPARDAGVVQVAARVVAAPVPRPSATLGSLDRPLLLAWAAASAVVLLMLLLSQQALRRQTAQGIVREVDGHLVCVTPAWGPAVVGGLRRATIVLPSWVTELGPDARRLAVRHEAEHLETGDVRLLALGALAAVACPWNPAIWWQLGRLRDAVELDCDHRLVRAGVDVAAYGALLLEVARRSPVGRLAPALAAHPSLLSMRIDHMTATPSTHRRLRAVLGAGLGALLVVLACEAPRPVAEDQGTSAVLDKSQLDTPPIRVSGPPLVYPPLLREAGIEGQVVLEFVVDSAGRVDPGSIMVVSSTNKAFERPAVDVVKRSIYRPAILDGVPRAMRTRQPVEFHIMKHTASPTTAPSGPPAAETTLVFVRPLEAPTTAPSGKRGTDTLVVVVTPSRKK
jgi:TonB family protein